VTPFESARDADKDASTWNVVAFLDEIKQRLNPRDWSPNRIVERLDQPGLRVSGPSGLLVLLRVIRLASDAPAAVDNLFGAWSHTTEQLSLLRVLLSPQHAQSAEVAEVFRLVPNKLPANASGNGGSSSVAADPKITPWTCPGVIRACARLGDLGLLD
jgi:hypothetical protein